MIDYLFLDIRYVIVDAILSKKNKRSCAVCNTYELSRLTRF